MSYIDVLDGANIATFPQDLRFFVIASFENAIGDFQFSAQVSYSGEKKGTPSLYVPLQATERMNLALLLPTMNLSKPEAVEVTLMVDGKPVRVETFKINALQNQSDASRV